MNLGLIGCGYIGRAIAGAVKEGKIKGKLQVITALNVSSVQEIAREHGCSYVTSVEEFWDYPMDLVVEAASQEAVKQYIPDALNRGIDAMVMSIGAFADSSFSERVTRLAREKGCSIHLPSGAIGGLDLLAAARQGSLERVMLTTRKPPSSLKQPGDSQEEQDNLQEPRIVFEGSARKAVELYPKNVNVAAALSLAGLGVSETRVKIIADPGVERNIHQVEAEGDFGSFKLIVENLPSPDNPKTSHLASLSGIALLARLCENIKVGN